MCVSQTELQISWERKLIELKREVETLTIIAGKYDIPFSTTDGTTRQNVNEMRQCEGRIF